MILGQRTVVYGVDNLKEAKKWYNKLFQKEPYFENETYIGYNIGGYELGLQQKKFLFGEQDFQFHKQDSGNITYWGVANIKKELQRIELLNIEILHPIMNVGANILMADFYDPYGNIIGLIENPNFSIQK